MAEKPQKVDEYLANIPEDQKSALQDLRKIIRAIIPDAEEVISYGLPAFKYGDKVIVGFSASKNHCSLVMFDGETVEAHADELKRYDTSKSTIRFNADNPLPKELVRKLVLSKLAKSSK